MNNINITYSDLFLSIFILQVFKERIYLDSIRWKKGNDKGDISRYQMVQYERIAQW